MFGSGHNPYRAAANRKAANEKAKAAWGDEILILPETVDEKDLKLYGELNSALYNFLVKESGWDKKVLEMRKKAAARIAVLPRKKEKLIYSYSDSYMRWRESSDEFFISEGLDLSDAELVVMRKTQHLDKKDFWDILYREIESLTGKKISLHSS